MGRQVLFSMRPNPVISAPKLHQAFSLSSKEIGTPTVKHSSTEISPESNSHVSEESPALFQPAAPKSEDSENPALFQPFSADEDPAMYEKGTFQYLFENSQFVKATDPKEKELLVEAEIIAVEGDKVYVDFGGKFHAVVTCPEAQRERCHSGGKVLITLQDYEMTKHFIGDTKHNSLLEAEAKFVRLVDNK